MLAYARLGSPQPGSSKRENSRQSMPEVIERKNLHGGVLFRPSDVLYKLPICFLQTLLTTCRCCPSDPDFYIVLHCFLTYKLVPAGLSGVFSGTPGCCCRKSGGSTGLINAGGHSSHHRIQQLTRSQMLQIGAREKRVVCASISAALLSHRSGALRSDSISERAGSCY